MEPAQFVLLMVLLFSNWQSCYIYFRLNSIFRMSTLVFKNIKPSSLRLGSSLTFGYKSRCLQTSPATLSVTGAKKIKRSDHYFQGYHSVNEVYHPSGAVKDIPPWYKLGIVKLTATFTLFLLIGAQLSKSGTKFLEENDIFKPEEDGDDDDDDVN